MPPDQLASLAAEAPALYRRGLHLLTCGRAAAAIPVLRGAVAVDERFALANIALAVAEHEVGNRQEWRDAAARAAAQRHISRRERQHVAVIALVLDGKLARASALGREHLREFAADILVIHVLTTRGVDLADLCPAQEVADPDPGDPAACSRTVDRVAAEDRDRRCPDARHL